jgi:conjugative transfer signal peptidase TraF
VTRRVGILALTALGALALLAPWLADVPPIVVWNATASAPIGLYAVIRTRELGVGDWVLLRLDASTAAEYAARGYLPNGVPLLKRIRAVAGMAVCAHDGALFVAGEHVADALPSDGAGRPLTAWVGCRTLATDEILVLNGDIPASLDGRYLGPSLRTSIAGRAIPLWTWNRS